MRRRTLLATGVAAIGVPTTGCTAWLLTRENSDTNSSDEQADESDSAADESPLGASTDGDDDGTETASKDNESANHPDAADPEPEPEVESGPEDIADEGEVETDDPTAEDVPITNANLRTASDGAVVSGSATNDSEAPLTVDLEVTFLGDGREIGRPALGGTTGLQPGDAWHFEIAAAGEEYSEATEYEIAKHVQPSG